MKRIVATFSLLTICFVLSFGQTEAELITIKKTFGGYSFYQGASRLTMNQLVTTMQPNEHAYKEIKAAQSTYTMAAIFAGAGGFLVGWPIGSAIGGGEPNWTLAAIGAGLIVISIPISQKFNKQAHNAVDTYNMGLYTSSVQYKRELRISTTPNGLGLLFRF